MKSGRGEREIVSRAWTTKRGMPGATAAMLCLGLSVPAGLHAQAPGVEASGQIGALVPTAEIVEGGEVTPGSAEVGKGLALGANLGLVFSSGMALELQGLWAPGPGINGTALEGGPSLGAVTVSVVQRLQIPVIRKVMVPFAGLGMGMRDLSFGEKARISGTEDRPDGDTSVVGEFFGGLYVKAIPGFKIRIEVRDYLSKASVVDQSNFQSDLAFLGGLAIGIP